MAVAIKMPGERAHKRWDSEQGRVELSRPGVGVVLVTMRGQIAGSLGTELAAELERIFGEETIASLFFDLEHMQHYDTAVRVECTRAMLAAGKELVVCAWTTSALVRMGISVANIALGGRMKRAASRRDFDDRIRVALEAA